MINKTRMVMALSLVMALGVVGIAHGDAASQVSTLQAKVMPSKLPKKKFVNVKLFTRVTTLSEGNDPVIPSAPSEKVFIDYDNDIRFNLKAAPECPGLPNGVDTETAKAICGSAVIGSGKAAARIPGWPATNNEVNDFVVTVFHGVGNQILLHAYSPSLPASQAQVIEGFIVKSPRGGDFGKRLRVPDVSDIAGDAGALVDFGATITKKRAVKARCFDRNRRLNYRGQWFYQSADGTDTGRDVVFTKQRCTRR